MFWVFPLPAFGLAAVTEQRQALLDFSSLALRAVVSDGKTRLFTRPTFHDQACPGLESREVPTDWLLTVV